ncbi:MAG: hypothetical protein ACXVLT_10130 [Flavisolibacter sp.]
MKSIHLRSITQAIFLGIASVLLLFYFNSCARKINFQGSSIVPAARGDVKIKKDNNNNYSIQIALSNLAEPKRLQPPKATYVVWMETDDNTTKNVGQINSSTGFLSGKLKASFGTVSATKPTRIFLTAEDDAGIQFPGSEVILTTKSF